MKGREVFYNPRQKIFPWLGGPHPLYDFEKKIFIDWNAKCGSVLAMLMFYKEIGVLEYALKKYSWIHKYRSQEYYKTKVKPLFLDEVLSPQILTLKIVRNPFSRAVSSYRHAMRRKSLCRRNNLGDDLSFMEFLEGISNKKKDDQHWQPQKRSIEDKYENFFDHVCKLEQIEKDISKVNISFGTSFDPNILREMNYMTGRFATKDIEWKKNVSCWKWSDLPHNALPPDICFYNDKCISLVNKKYREDIECYKYSIEDIR